ncbi:MAG: adenylate/guanylate cyclase domain-containing protein [Acidimicrobiales bacterium]
MTETPVATTRVVRTFAFIDLSGFTAYTNDRGDDDAVDVLRQFRVAVREASSSRGVRIAKWLGDGAMLVGVETEPVVEAVVDIEKRISAADTPLPLRAGISVGPVILFEGDDYIGHAVNIAARLCDEAASHEVLAVVEAGERLMGSTRVEPAGSRDLPGLDDPLPVVRLSARA